MEVMRALWVGMLGAALTTPAWATGGRIHFVGSIVVPAACTAAVQIRRGAPNVTADCSTPESVSVPSSSQVPYADVTVRPLQDHSAQASGPRRYVVDMTYR